jgi:hypothetical protein
MRVPSLCKVFLRQPSCLMFDIVSVYTRLLGFKHPKYADLMRELVVDYIVTPSNRATFQPIIEAEYGQGKFEEGVTRLRDPSEWG